MTNVFCRGIPGLREAMTRAATAIHPAVLTFRGRYEYAPVVYQPRRELGETEALGFGHFEPFFLVLLCLYGLCGLYGLYGLYGLCVAAFVIENVVHAVARCWKAARGYWSKRAAAPKLPPRNSASEV